MPKSNGCPVCDTPIDPNLIKCTGCGRNNLTLVSDASPDITKGIPLSKVVAADVDRLRTGPWDECFGKTFNEKGEVTSIGMVRTSAILLGGSPGAGKSTMSLQMCSNVAGKKGEGPALYVMGEEALEEVKTRANRLRLLLKNMDRIIMIPALGGANLADCIDAQTEKPSICIVDSLQALGGDENDAQARICEVAKEYSVRYKFPTLIISHVTKGDEIAGLIKLQHKVDTTGTFFPDEDTTDNEQELEPLRTIRILKNRFGRAYIERYFEMTGEGLVEPAEVDEDEDED